MKALCVNCHELVAVDDADAGAEVVCGACGQVTVIPEAPTAPGAVLGDFQLGDAIGEEPTGLIYRAHQMSLDRQVALEILRLELVADQEFLRLYLSGARLAARLNHPHILKVHAVGQDEGLYFTAMELVQGPTVRQYLLENPNIESVAALEMIRQALEALDYAWEHHELPHGNLNPSTFRLTVKQDVKLAGFGLQPATGEDERARYRAPEVLAGGPPTPASDIYGLGATLYHMVTGLCPWEWIEPGDLVDALPSATLLPPHKINATVPQEVADLITRWMAINPADRPPSTATARDEVAALRDALLAAEAAIVAAAQAEAQALADAEAEAAAAAAEERRSTRSRGITRQRVAAAVAAHTASPTATRTQLEGVAAQATLEQARRDRRLRMMLYAFLLVGGLIGVGLFGMAVYLGSADETPTTPAQATIGKGATPGKGTASGGDTPVTPEPPPEEDPFKPHPGPTAYLSRDSGILKILPMGDKFVVGYDIPGGFRGYLYERFKDAPYPILMVGDRKENPDRDRMSEFNHEGYSNNDISRITDNGNQDRNQLEERLARFEPTVILLYAGTREIESTESRSSKWWEAADKLDALITRAVAAQPKTYIIVSTLIPSRNPTTELLVQAYNQQIAERVRRHMLAGERVALLDLHGSIRPPEDPEADYPSASDFRKASAEWYDAIMRWTRLRPPRSWSGQVLEGVKATSMTGPEAAPAAVSPTLTDGQGFENTQGETLAAPKADGFGWVSNRLEWTGQPLSWMAPTDDLRPILTFDLGQQADVKRLDIWNGRLNARGQVFDSVRQVEFRTSADGEAWQKRGVFTLNKSRDLEHQPGETFGVWWPKVRYVRMIVLDSWSQSGEGQGTGYFSLGLSKVRFFGQHSGAASASSPAPQP